MGAGGCYGWNYGASLYDIGSGVDGGRKLVTDFAQIYTRGYRKMIRNTGLSR